MDKLAPEIDKKEKKRSSLFIGSVEKTFLVLEIFDGMNSSMTMAQISRTAGLDRSATQRIVHTLEQLGYLKRSKNSTTYSLSSRFLRFSYNYLRSNKLIEKASPHLLELSRSIGETCNLQELDDNEVVFIARFPGKHLVNVDFAVGYRRPAAYTASGIAMMSHLPLPVAKEIIRSTKPMRVTPFTITDQEKIIEQVKSAYETGYAIVSNQTVVGDISVSAAVLDHHGYPMAAITVSCATTRWTVKKAEEIIVPHVQVAATAISDIGEAEWV